MGVPHHQQTDADGRTTGCKRHPLGHPLGKVVHGIHDGGVYLLKIAFVSVCEFVGIEKVPSCPVVEAFIENAMRRGELH
jgi:hypothetical protein